MRYDVVTIVASRRGMSQLRELVANLPPQFGMPVVCLTEADALLITEIAASTPLHVKWAESGETLQPGCVYFSPPGSSIVVLEGRRITLAPVGPESTSQHPVDNFLSSASRVYGNRALAVVLSAFPDDGAEGAHNVKWRGGTVLVLDRATAQYYGMADAIVRRGSYDRILTAEEVANALRASFTGRDLLQNAELHFELGLLLDQALRISGTHMGNVRIVEPEPRRLHIIAHRGLDRRFLERFGVVQEDEPTACARALRFGSRIVIENILDDPEYRPYVELARRTGYSAEQATPIRNDGHVAGTISTLYPTQHLVTTYEARNLDEIAEAARVLVAANA
jgi:hypothetical protein